MKILIIAEHANFGGHVQSARTTARELLRNGHDVIFATGEGSLIPDMQKEFKHFLVPFHYRHCDRETYFAIKSWETVVRISKIVKDELVEMVHAFDARSYIASIMVSLFKFTIPVTGTLCGGVTPYYNIPVTGKFIVFSEEQKEKMITKFGWHQSNICVCSTRLDMAQFTVGDDQIRQLCNEYGIVTPGKYVMMITTFLELKEGSVRQTLEAVKIVLEHHKDYSFILIGGKGGFFQESKRIGERINKSLGRKAIVFTGLIPDAYRMLKAATVVVGLGRSAFEGMAFEKPTLIVGDKGYAGTVSRKNIEAIAYYNFSGRNQKNMVPKQELANEIIKLIEDENYYNDVKSFGKEYLLENISIQAGIGKIQNVYRENIAFSEEISKYVRIINLCKVLFLIIFDNYYNQAKKFIFRRG